MSYGQEVRIDNLGLGLASHIGDSDLPAGAALVEDNFTLDELGALQKRDGISRFIQRQFTGVVRAIIPIEDCFGTRAFMIASDDLRVENV